MIPRNLVYRAFEFENTDGRAPRQLWSLPLAELMYPREMERIRARWPDDIIYCHTSYACRPPTQGDPCGLGEYVDEWGCRFLNVQQGVMGEVKQPMFPPEDEDWSDTSAVHVPTELLSFSIEEANAFCAGTDRFVLGSCCPRIFEQLQFIRGTEQLLMDIFDGNTGLLRFMETMHNFYCRLLEKWAQTDVDGLTIMDDWGSQRALLIDPQLWRRLFKPLYRQYAQIAHAADKKLFMHSDGYILDILPDLVEIGVDALNSQIFCMGVPQLAPYAGRITFWGEVDRQNLLPYGSPPDIYEAVDQLYGTLWKQGGCIAQCEFGAGARPENVDAVFDAWEQLTAGGKI